MSETYAIKAVLSAVDNGLISTMDKAVSSLNGITKKSDIFGNSAGNSFRRASESARDFTSSVAKLATAIGITQAVSAGINAMKNSMGAAVSRMDTLNNSSRVFKNMGFAAEDTSKMMDKLQDSIKGLPTPLDEAVKGVQMIASSTGDIGKSQEIWSALNDSILGFGGSTADVNNAVLQLSQAFSNGKIDGMTWISMMNSQMGPVLSAIAKQLGLTTGQLRDGLASGKISVQQFQDALIELDKNGGGGLASLHQIALTATGGISTSMQNAKTSVVRGLTEMIQSFDTFSQSVTGLSLSQIITQIGTAVEGVLDRVAATIPKAADYFKNLGLTANQSKGLITGFVTAAMGIGALVALAPVIGSVVTAFGGLFSIVGKVTNVFSGLVGFLVTPWGAAAVAIGLVVVVLADLYATFQPFHDAINNTVSAFIQGFRQSIPAAIQAVKSVLDTLKNDLNIIGQAIQEQIGGSLKSIDIQTFQSMFTTAFQSIGSAIQIVINTLTQVIQGFIQVGALQAIWEAIKAVITAIGTVLQTVIGIISQYLGQSPGVSNSASAWQTVGTVVGNFAVFLANAITKLADFITNISNAVQQMSPLQQGLIAAGGAAALLGAKFLISGGGAQALADKLLGLGGNSDKAKSSLNGTANESSNLGTQIGIAAAGIGIGAAGIAYLAQQGTAGAIALSGMTAAVVIMTGAFAKFGPSLQQSAAGITAFGTAILELGAGIAIASAGLTLLANTGKSGITVITTLTVAVTALAAVFAALGPRLTAGSEGIVSFGVSVAAMGIGIGTAAAGIAALVAAFTGLISIMTNLNISTTQLIQNAQALGTALGVMIVSAISNVATGLQKLAPLFMQTILAIGQTIATGAPQLAQEFLTLIIGIVSVVADNLPRLFESGTELVINFIKGITQNLGEVIPAALQMLTTFISAVADNLQPVIESGLNLLVQFLYGLAQGLPQVIGAVAKVIATFLKSLADHIQEIINAGVKLLVNFLKGIADNLNKVVTAVVNVIDKFIRAVADNIEKIINSGIYLLEKFVLGIVKAIPKVTNVAFKVINEFVYAVGYALGKIVSSGGKLIAAFAKGIWDGVSGSKKAGNANINAIKSAIDSTNLFKSGQAIINGFLNGMKSAFNNVKDWIGGIGDWIRKHKGPIQYDRKLLIPAGNAIMQGLNFGLVSAFKDVQGNVSNMAKSIAEAANNNLSSNLNNINAKLANGTINHAVSGQLEIQQQPAYIQLQMGDNTFNAYVDDITKRQNISLDLGRF